MLVIFTNHPAKTPYWSAKQLNTAQEMFGEVVDVSFPNIDPEASTYEIQELAQNYLNEIVQMCQGQSLAVLVQGEMAFVYAFLTVARQLGIPCFCATSKRKVFEKVENGEIKKTSVFEFCKFRSYF